MGIRTFLCHWPYHTHKGCIPRIPASRINHECSSLGVIKLSFYEFLKGIIPRQNALQPRGCACLRNSSSLSQTVVSSHRRRCPLGLSPHHQYLPFIPNKMREAGSQTPELKSNRRRSLGALFRIPLSTRSPDYHSISTSKPVGSIPADIIREIADLLSPADILNFSLTVRSSFHHGNISNALFQSQGLRALLLAPLYESVALRSSRKCEVTLNMLAERPDICALIHKFAVRPNYYLAWPKPDKPLDESWVSSKIAEIAPNLSSLTTFDWDGLEVPMDDLWGKLRISYVIRSPEPPAHSPNIHDSCPDLRSIFCNVGTLPLDPESQVLPLLTV